MADGLTCPSVAKRDDPMSGPTKAKEPTDDAGRNTAPNKSLGHLIAAEVRESTTDTCTDQRELCIPALPRLKRFTRGLLGTEFFTPCLLAMEMRLQDGVSHCVDLGLLHLGALLVRPDERTAGSVNAAALRF